MVIFILVNLSFQILSFVILEMVLICIAILSVRLIEKFHYDVTYKWDEILSMMLDG
jgi:hypothetical protein